ncbi:MAG: phosphate regulon sensor histidine kinase PhoR [Cellvibrionaceae bacterium]
MHRGFAVEIRRVIIITLVAIIFGTLNGYLTWTLIVCGALYMGWTLWQIRRLDTWLVSRKAELPPEASGIWGDIFDRIYHLQKRHEREKERLQSVLHRVQDTTAALPDAVVLLDPRGNITWWNETATNLIGFHSTDKSQPLINFVRSPRFIRYFEQADYREPITITSPYNNAKKIQFQITVYGQGERLVLIRDVTRIQRLEQMRKDFVGNVSHELRTPLTVIKGYLETLEDHIEVAPTWKKPIAQMQEQSKRMNLLINDLIALSQLETDDQDYSQTAVPIAQLLNGIRAEADVVADGEYTITVECDTEKSIRGSQKELHSAISNLVINGIKYSPKGSEIIIKASCNEKGCQISVTDNGIGIDAIHIPRLTERFYRVDESRSINTGGTGLGLAIVKHVLLRHDAKLFIESQPGEGSTFFCTFPANRIMDE